eukprot:6184547-Pleurochrysis_carterae.AAC.5
MALTRSQVQCGKVHWPDVWRCVSGICAAMRSFRPAYRLGCRIEDLVAPATPLREWHPAASLATQ